MAEESSDREPTLSSDTAVHIRGWNPDDADAARLFGERVLALTQEYSRWLDLSRLLRIVVAADYRAAVAEVASVDGVPNVATSNEYSEGAATALMTVEDGVLGSVLVVWTPMIVRIFEPIDSLERRMALQTYVHELVHVDDQAFLDRTFPGGAMAAVQSDDRHGSLLMMVAPAPAEYSAASRTAMIEPATGYDFLNLLEGTIADALSDVRRQRRLYRVRAISLEDFWPWVQERSRFIFQALGYAIGHCDGILRSDRADDELKEGFTTALARIEGMELGWLVSETKGALLPIMEQPAWSGLGVFDPLIEVGERLLNAFGIFTRLEQGMLYVDVPLSDLKDL
jgi:hypothetical protein